MTSTIPVPAGHTLYSELDVHFTEPEVTYPAPAQAPERATDETVEAEAAAAIDEQILAGLVSP
jgi:hypothetical protein